MDDDRQPPAPTDMRKKEEHRRMSWEVVGEMQWEIDWSQGGGFACGIMVVSHKKNIPCKIRTLIKLVQICIELMNGYKLIDISHDESSQMQNISCAFFKAVFG